MIRIVSRSAGTKRLCKLGEEFGRTGSINCSDEGELRLHLGHPARDRRYGPGKRRVLGNKANVRIINRRVAGADYNHRETRHGGEYPVDEPVTARVNARLVHHTHPRGATTRENNDSDVRWIHVDRRPRGHFVSSRTHVPERPPDFLVILHERM